MSEEEYVLVKGVKVVKSEAEVLKNFQIYQIGTTLEANGNCIVIDGHVVSFSDGLESFSFGDNIELYSQFPYLEKIRLDYSSYNEEDYEEYEDEDKDIHDMPLENFKIPENINLLKNLKTFEVQNEALCTITLPPSFSELKNLKKLYFAYVNLASTDPKENLKKYSILPKCILELPELEEIVILNNFIKKLPVGIGKLKNLKKLFIQNTDLSSVPDEIGDLTNLEELTLGSNQLKQLPESIGNLKKLKVLNLNCQGSINDQKITIPESIGKLENLEKLFLNWSKCSKIPESIGNLTNLKVLSANGCWRSDYNNILPRLISLKEIHFSMNNLGVLPEDFGNLIHLEILDIARCSNVTLPESIGNCINLKEINAEYCGVKKLPESITNCTKLKYLKLDNNELTQLPKNMGNLEELFVKGLIFLNNNKLKELPESMENIPIGGLTLSHNDFSKFPPVILKLKHLKYLDISNNHIDSIPEELGNLRELTHLNLSNNKISEIPESLSRLVNLELIDISNNKLTKFPNQFEKLTKLKQIYCKNNPIPAGEENSIEGFKKLYEVAWAKISNKPPKDKENLNYLYLNSIDNSKEKATLNMVFEGIAIVKYLFEFGQKNNATEQIVQGIIALGNLYSKKLMIRNCIDRNLVFHDIKTQLEQIKVTWDVYSKHFYELISDFPPNHEFIINAGWSYLKLNIPNISKDVLFAIGHALLKWTGQEKFTNLNLKYPLNYFSYYFIHHSFSPDKINSIMNENIDCAAKMKASEKAYVDYLSNLLKKHQFDFWAFKPNGLFFLQFGEFSTLFDLSLIVLEYSIDGGLYIPAYSFAMDMIDICLEHLDDKDLYNKAQQAVENFKSKAKVYPPNLIENIEKRFSKIVPGKYVNNHEEE